MKEKINSLNLKHHNAPVSFAIKTMEEIDQELGGIADEPHRHSYYTIIWSYTATGKHIIDFNEYPIVPQHIFFVSPGQVHQIISDPNPTGVVILFTPEFLQKNSINENFISNLKLFRDSNETPPLPINDDMQIKLDSFAGAMFKAYNSSDEMKYEALGAYLKLFLIECNNFCLLFPGSNTQKIEVGRSLVQRFKSIVENRFNQWHQVKDYAEQLNVSPNYLNEVIKSSINISAKDYIQNRLILEAKRMTIYTDKSVKEIGYYLGFEDPSHFSKFFKSYTGQSFQGFKEGVKKLQV
jgi:AraC family transcriptional regulator, transcriptional activator of pobA